MSLAEEPQPAARERGPTAEASGSSPLAVTSDERQQDRGGLGGHCRVRWCFRAHLPDKFLGLFFVVGGDDQELPLPRITCWLSRRSLAASATACREAALDERLIISDT